MSRTGVTMRRGAFGARSCKGVAAVEFVIAVPVLLLVMLAVAELGRAFLQYDTLSYSIRSSARYVSEHALDGKNIVITLLECSGFQVIDLGVDVPASKFVDAVKETGAELVGMSLMLTTAMDSMRQAIRLLEHAAVRDRIKIMIGGAPTSERLREDVRADFHGRDAIEALAFARRVFNQ